VAVELPSKALTILGKKGSGETTIDCQNSAPYGIVVAGTPEATPVQVILRGLTIQRATDAAIYSWVPRSLNTKVEDCVLAHNGRGILAAFSNLQVLDSTVHDNTSDGLDFAFCQYLIEGCSLFANEGNGIFLSGDGRGSLADCRIQRNTLNGVVDFENLLEMVNCEVTRNRGNGIVAGEFILTAVNCTVASNRGSGVFLYDVGILKLQNCILWDHPGGSIAFNQFTHTVDISVTYSCLQGDLSPGEGNINLDPLLKKNFQLSRGSPAIDTGSLEGAPSTDLDGRPRPLGAGVDMGAYEYRRPGPIAAP
jgi:hypothetical protein